MQAEITKRTKRIGIPDGITMGPFMRLISCAAAWQGEDNFPKSQIWADEIERVLAFLAAQNQFGRFRSRFLGKARLRDAALAEARVAFFLHRNRFRITAWEPPGANGRLGEFEVTWNHEERIFVEVKAPDWEGELSLEEKTGPRKAQGKSVDLEGRFVDPLAQPLDVITKNALPKLPVDRPNLIVIADNLFLSPVSVPFLDEQMDTYFTQPSNAPIGGILFFLAESNWNEIDYLIRFHENKAAYEKCRLPTEVVAGFNACTDADYNRKVRFYWT